MKAYARLLICAVVLLIISAASFADPGRNENRRNDRNWSVTGRVVSKSSGDNTIDICDSSHKYYTILAKDSRIYDGDRTIRLRDIRRNDLVQAYGDLHRDGTVDARSIYRLDNRERDDFDRIKVQGEIKKIDRDRRWLDLRVGNDNLRVRINDDTRIYSRSDRKEDIGYLRKDQAVNVEGYRTGRDEIAATTIFEGRDTVHRVSHILVRVTREASIFDRRLSVIPVAGQNKLPDVFDMNVPKSVEIERRGRGISVHDIQIGDVLNVKGYWDGDSFVPNTILVNQRADQDCRSSEEYRSITGTVLKVSSDGLEFTLQTRQGSLTVYADRARVWDGNNIVDAKRLRHNEEVAVRGNIDGNKVDAERIDLISGS